MGFLSFTLGARGPRNIRFLGASWVLLPRLAHRQRRGEFWDPPQALWTR